MGINLKIIQLTIAYSLAGAFVFTLGVTCASLIGLVRFEDSKQQKKLFYLLIVEVVIICLTFFQGYLNYNPALAQREIIHSTKERLKKMDKYADDQVASIRALAQTEKNNILSNWDKIYYFAEKSYHLRFGREPRSFLKFDDRKEIASISTEYYNNLILDISREELKWIEQIKSVNTKQKENPYSEDLKNDFVESLEYVTALQGLAEKLLNYLAQQSDAG